MSRLAEYMGSRELVVNLTLRELRGKYKRSVLGWTWSLLNPLSTVLIFSLVFGFFLKIQPPVGHPSGLHNFAVFLLCGLLPWNYLSSTMTQSMGALVGNSNLIKKVYFPREMLVVATVGSLVVTLLIELSVLVVILLLLGNMVLPWLPVVIMLVAIQTAFVLGIGLLLSCLNVYFRDVQHLVGISLQALFYSAPIVYPIRVVPKEAHLLGHDIPFRFLYSLNPLVRLVGAYRDAMYNLRFPAFHDVLYLVVWAAGLVILGLMVFSRMDARLAEEV